MKSTTSTNKPDGPTAGKRKRRIPVWLMFPLLGFLLAAAVAAGRPLLYIFTGGNLMGQQITRPPFDGRTQFTLLVIGLDQPDKLFPEKGRRSDTILLTSVDLTTKMITGVSIPRDTRVKLEDDGGWTKINSAYTENGVEGVVSVVREITGVSPDYFVVLDTASTRQLVDLVGGVDVTVDKRMKYDDNWQDLHIDLKPGAQRLNGEQAVGFVRFRHDATGDIARMKRQQMFIRAMAKRLVAPENLTRLPLVVPELRRQVQTNIADEDLLYLANQMRDVPSTHFEFQSIDGESRMIRRISYFLPYEEKMKASVLHAVPGAVVPDSPRVDTLP